MKGLIIKDFLNLKRSGRTFAFLLLFYAVMSFAMKSPSFIGGMFSLVFAMLVLSTYSFDDMAKWDSFALTMPISKDNIVQGKYIIMLILTVIGFAVSFLMLALMDFVLKSDEFLKGLLISGVGSGVIILFYCIIIPFITKLGVEKARYIMVAVYMIPFLFGTVLVSEIKKHYKTPPEKLIEIGNFLLKYAYIILPLFVIAALLISYSISLRIYRKREF